MSDQDSNNLSVIGHVGVPTLRRETGVSEERSENFLQSRGCAGWIHKCLKGWCKRGVVGCSAWGRLGAEQKAQSNFNHLYSTREKAPRPQWDTS